jgi:hypothetical protein
MKTSLWPICAALLSLPLHAWGGPGGQIRFYQRASALLTVVPFQTTMALVYCDDAAIEADLQHTCC